MPRLTRQSKPEAASNANGETQSSPTVPPIAEVTSETINGMTDSIPIKRGRGRPRLLKNTQNGTTSKSTLPSKGKIKKKKRKKLINGKTSAREKIKLALKNARMRPSFVSVDSMLTNGYLTEQNLNNNLHIKNEKNEDIEKTNLGNLSNIVSEPYHVKSLSPPKNGMSLLAAKRFNKKMIMEQHAQSAASSPVVNKSPDKKFNNLSPSLKKNHSSPFTLLKNSQKAFKETKLVPSKGNSLPDHESSSNGVTNGKWSPDFSKEDNSPKQFSCEFCDFVTISTTSIKKHRARHTGEGMMQCQYSGCDYKTIHKYLLKVHEATYHTGIGLIECQYCPFKSARRERYKIHLRTHVRSGVAPPNAVEEFAQQCAEDNHRMKKEGKCKKNFFLRKEVSLQKVAIQNSAAKKICDNIVPSLANGVPPSAIVSPFKMKEDVVVKPSYSYVAKESSSNKGLGLTKKESSSDEKYSCNQCEYVATDIRTMHHHLAIHKVENNMSCEFCSFTTDNESYLKVHLTSHNGVAKSLCPLCEFSCDRNKSYHLKKHLSQHFSPGGQHSSHCEDSPLLSISDQILGYHQSCHLYDSQHKLSFTAKQNIFLQTAGVL